MFDKGNLLFKVQATVWKDKKEIGFPHNHLVTTVDDDTENVQRWDREKRRKVRIRSPKVVKDYQDNMNGVDCKDHDTADWGTSIRTCRYYLRIFFGALTAYCMPCIASLCSWVQK
jgi:hypothetical protein